MQWSRAQLCRTLATRLADLDFTVPLHSKSLMRFDTPTARLRALAFVEGISYLVLLFVAMPLKYLMGEPLAVRIVGMAHGILFLGLALATLGAMLRRGKSFGWGLRLGLASLLPFGTFFLDAGLMRDDEEYRAKLANRHL